MIQTNLSVLVCPYPLMEEEALAWAVLLFGRVILLHPYPLTIPPGGQEALEKGFLSILTLPRTPAEIKEKDKILKEWERFSTHVPGMDFLKYLAGVASWKDGETADEIIAALRGEGKGLPAGGMEGVDGFVLLCGMHQVYLQAWEMRQTLTAVEAQEQQMIRGWIEDGEGGSLWGVEPQGIKRQMGFELQIPSALKAWEEMRKRMMTETVPLITDQSWLWKGRYGQDPEDSRSMTLRLPPLESLFQAQALAQGQGQSLGNIISSLLNGPDHDRRTVSISLMEALSALGLTGEGGYALVLPPVPEAEEEEVPSDFLLNKDKIIYLAPR